MSGYEAATEGVTIVDGVEVDITVRGEEDKAEKTLMDLKERLGRIGAAYANETPPSELGANLDNKYLPLMTVDWEGVFSDDD